MSSDAHFPIFLPQPPSSASASLMTLQRRSESEAHSNFIPRGRFDPSFWSTFFDLLILFDAAAASFPPHFDRDKTESRIVAATSLSSQKHRVFYVDGGPNATVVSSPPSPHRNCADRVRDHPVPFRWIPFVVTRSAVWWVLLDACLSGLCCRSHPMADVSRVGGSKAFVLMKNRNKDMLPLQKSNRRHV